MTASLPLFVLNRVAGAALFRTHELIGEVKNRGLRQTVLRGRRTGAGLQSRVLLGVAFTEVFGTAGGDLVHTDHTAFFSVLKEGVMLKEVVKKFFFLDDVVLQRTHTLGRLGEIRVVPDLLSGRIDMQDCRRPGPVQPALYRQQLKQLCKTER